MFTLCYIKEKLSNDENEYRQYSRVIIDGLTGADEACNRRI